MSVVIPPVSSSAGEPVGVRVLDLPSMYRLVLWGVLFIMLLVPSYEWFARTNHLLVDSTYAALVSWSPRVCMAMFAVWSVILHLHGTMWTHLPMVITFAGTAGALINTDVVGHTVVLMCQGMQQVRAGVRVVLQAVPRVPVRVPWIALALLGVALQMASSLPSSPPNSSLLPSSLPRVVNCSYGRPDLERATTSDWPLVPNAPHAYAGGDNKGALLWAARLLQWEWIVDSGAELMIAGAFIYPYSTVVLRSPDVRVKGVDGSMTPVDSVVRTMVRLPDGDHCIREILVCDSFQLALWSTEYMASFGFSTFLMASGDPSYIRTPAGRNVTLAHQPYRLAAPCRVPTRVEYDSLYPSHCRAAIPHAPPAPPPALPAPESEPLAANCTASRWVWQLHARSDGQTRLEDMVVGVAPARVQRREITVDEAWRLHFQFMHAGWRTIAETCHVRIPPNMPKCDTCEITKSKRTPQSAHGIVSTFAGQLTHSDTWGPFCSALYYKGCRYIVAFVDDYSRVKLAVFCKDRTTQTLLAAYKVWHAFMSSLGAPPTGTWQSDGGPEYVSNDAFDFCDEHAIQRLLSVRYVPPQNGIAESVFRVHIPRVRAACRGCGATKEAYALAMQHSLWLSNRTWSKQLGCCPFDRVPHPPPPSLHRAKPFGCRMWAHQPDVDIPDKMADTARAGVFMGMSEVFKGVICYYPDTHEFEAAIHASYEPDVMPIKAMLPPPSPPAPLPSPTPLPPLYVPSGT